MTAPERKSLRFLTPILCALGAAAFLSLAIVLKTQAAPPPTLSITMGNTAVTSGATSDVTFSFSTTPFGFDNADVDLSDANGTISTVAATADDRVYTATYTPNAGVDDDTNTIIVGTGWNDSGGVSPAAPSSSQNFTVHTAAAPSGSSCPSPSVRISSPNDGEVLTAGTTFDILWTVEGCQLQSLDLTLSTDGGQTFTVPVGTSANPLSGYYAWTVPELDASAARLQAVLHGQGGAVLATDVTDGDFTLKKTAAPPAPSAATSTPASPPPPTPPPATAPASATGTTGTPPAPLPDPSTTPPAPATATTTPATAGTTTAAPTPPRPTTTAAKPPAPPMPVAPPMPNVPMPADAAPPQPDQPMPAPAAQTQPITLDSAQSAVDTASSYVPSSLEMVFSFAAGALAMLAFFLGAQKIAKARKAATTQPCSHCRGTGVEPKKPVALKPCDDCDGTGMVEEETEQDIECKHCEGEGEDPCHVCKGTGKDASGAECKACHGGGKTLKDPDDEDSEPADCEICRGEGEVTVTLKHQVPCKTCNGTGKV